MLISESKLINVIVPLSVLSISESKLGDVIVLPSYMLYICILEQNEILRLRHALVLVSLTDKCLNVRQEMVHIPQIIDTLSRSVCNEEVKFV